MTTPREALQKQPADTPAPRFTAEQMLLAADGLDAGIHGLQFRSTFKAMLRQAADLASAPTREELITTITSVPILNGNGWIGNYDERIADALIAAGVRVRA